MGSCGLSGEQNEGRKMTRFETLLIVHSKGILSPHWMELEFAETITPENVDELMPRLPPDVREGLRRWDLSEPGMVIGAEMSEAERQRIEAQLAIAVPAIRDWFARHDTLANGGDAMATSPPKVTTA